MHRLRQLWVPLSVVFISGLISSFQFPLFPVDETRYLSVAWDMKVHDSFIVPLLNGLPYSHKPPLLFWLVNLDWAIFGVNEATLRLIPVLFSMLNIVLVHRIALQLWGREETAQHAAAILSSTFSYLLCSSLIMFDVMLTFWVLVGFTGLLSAAGVQRAKPWLLVGVAIGGGILAKGPVVLVYLLPLALFVFWLIPEERFPGRWYAWLMLSLLTGAGIVLIWLVPAALMGGKPYRDAILWGQTVNRMTNSFAHKLPFWWYLPWLPALLLPWILLKPVWRGSLRPAGDAGARLLMFWITATVIIFSLISGKRVHYLIPILPAFSLLMARNLACGSGSHESGGVRYAVAALYFVLGVTLGALSFTDVGNLTEDLGGTPMRLASAGLIAIGLALYVSRPRSLGRFVTYTALASAAFYAVLVLNGSQFLARYDVGTMAAVIKNKQDEGFDVIHYGKYHGQYQFAGRLTKPLVVLDSREAVAEYAAARARTALVTYQPEEKVFDPADLIFRQPFRGRQVVLLNKRGIERFCMP